MAGFVPNYMSNNVNSDYEEITLTLPPGIVIPIEPNWDEMYVYNLEQIPLQMQQEGIVNTYDGPGSNMNCRNCLLLGWKLGFKTGYSQGAMEHYNLSLRPQTPIQGVGNIVSEPSTPGGTGGKKKRKTIK